MGEMYTILNEKVQGTCETFELLDCLDAYSSNNCLSKENCTDGTDNDGDGFIDSQDQECYEYRKIILNQGWNFVASPYDTDMNASQALIPIEGCYKGIYSYGQGLWNRFLPGNMFNSIDKIQPYKGYWINVNCSTVHWLTII